jgi:spore cortex biosynthesis protein YabQ
MTVSISSQAYIFFCTVIGGMVVALIYDLFRIKRKAIKTGNLLTYIEDLLFWILVAVVMFITVYYSNEGELRSYLFLGMLIGIILYALLLSKPIMSSSLFIINVVSKIFKAVWFLVSYPVRIILKLMAIPVRISSKYVRQSARSIRRASRNRLFKAVIWKKIFRNIRKKI